MLAPQQYKSCTALLRLTCKQGLSSTIFGNDLHEQVKPAVGLLLSVLRTVSKHNSVKLKPLRLVHSAECDMCSVRWYSLQLDASH
jgi:hypothetical protein